MEILTYADAVKGPFLCYSQLKSFAGIRMRELSKTLGAFLRQDLKADEEFRLVGLWRNWDDILGPLGPLARPLGHRGSTLLVGAATSLDLQEITYYTPQILTNVNAFLGQKFFDKVQADLLMDRTSLDAVGSRLNVTREFSTPDSGQVGNLKSHMEPGSAVDSCYQAYVRLVNKGK
ncbi:MAG: DUF721 domain-containing protein [Desulfovibrio sp.]|nr:MAG: DUF721 domain-containing protein [Desulfovibrio sp.]